MPHANRRSRFVIVGVFFAALLAAALAHARPRQAAPAPIDWSPLDTVVEHAIAEKQLPGAVLEIGHDGRVVYRKAYGERALEPRREPMTVDTIFDLASLTKVVSTAPSVMLLVESGKLRLNDPVAEYLPRFGQNGKEQITVRELLTHYSGLQPDIPDTPRWSGYEEGLERAYALAPKTPPGSHFEYSDINYVVLAELVRKLSGERIDEFALTHLWQPLDMTRTRYLPPEAWRPLIAPTERYDCCHFEQGQVNDPTASAMGGVTGDAGVFSDADDLAKYAQMLLNGGLGANGTRVLAPVSVEKMTTPQTPFNSPDIRGFGWDLDSPFSSNRGDLLPIGSYGHTGFTGTSLWMDPFSDTFIVLLSNSIHPDGRPPLLTLRADVANAVAGLLSRNVDPDAQWRALEPGLERITGYNDVGVLRRPVERNGDVLNGLDVLAERHFSTLVGRRVGLITNPSGVDREGKRNIDDLVAAGIHVTAAFAPEHGWSGTLNGPVGDTRDAKTGVPVYSTYGAGDAAKSLPEAGLRNVDVLVYDIQDLGVRFFTYETTLADTLIAGAAHRLPVIVLDRPAPLGGLAIQGPPLAPEERGFVGYFPGMPVRNGMTAGELARLFNSENHIGASLQVISMRGWSRGDYFDNTGLPWTDPSPNMRSLAEAVLYPGVAMLEGTNLSVGRGTNTPFEQLGAPWIAMPGAVQMAAYLNQRRLPGIRFLAVGFTPATDKFAGRECHGLNLIVTDRDLLDPTEMGVEIAAALNALFPKDWDSSEMHQLAGSQSLVDQIRAGGDPRRIADDWQAADKAFQDLRAPYLLYP